PKTPSLRISRLLRTPPDNVSFVPGLARRSAVICQHVQAIELLNTRSKTQEDPKKQIK
ncbi:hypothetical protein BaRGS_00029088, partial [Batillaria attramentaria]